MNEMVEHLSSDETGNDPDVFTSACDRCGVTVGYEGGEAFAEGWAEIWVHYGDCVATDKSVLCPDCQEKPGYWLRRFTRWAEIVSENHGILPLESEG
jgi:hypothetical protein